MTDFTITGCTAPTVLVGDAPPEEPGTTVQTQRQWVEGLSSHQKVLAQYAMRSAQDVEEDRIRAQRLAEIRQRAEDEEDLVRLGFAAPPRSHAQVLADYATEQARLDKLEDDLRTQRAEERAIAAEERPALAQAELAEERRAHQRAENWLATAREGWASARRRAEQRESAEQYARSHAGSSVYYR